MIEASIPGGRQLHLEHLLLDYNGTLALDGELLPGVSERLHQLARSLRIWILTADTFGKVRQSCSTLPAEIRIVSGEQGAQDKASLVQVLGPDQVAAIGNGFNDHLMLQLSALSILVIGPEGAATRSLLNSQIVVGDICQALDLLLHQQRLVATLRS